MTGFPVTVNYLPGERNSHLELGAGLVPVIVTFNGQVLFFGNRVRGKEIAILETVTIGYRYQPTSGGFVLRIGFTPLFNLEKILPWGGISIGVAF